MLFGNRKPFFRLRKGQSCDSFCSFDSLYVALSSIFDIIKDNVVPTWIDSFILIEKEDVIFDITLKACQELRLKNDVVLRWLATFALFELMCTSLFERLL